MQPSDFPLAWPEGQPRAAARIKGRFKVGFQSAYDSLVTEAEKLHDAEDRDVVVSTAIPLGKRGLPLVALSDRIGDPGACVYLWRGGRPYALACDTYLDLHHNLRSLAVTLGALRQIQRHGATALMERSLAGFARTKPPYRPTGHARI